MFDAPLLFENAKVQKKYVSLHFILKKMEKISAVIIAQDEERNIGRCLKSLQGVADEVVVVDSGSKDSTGEVCRGYGARFIEHPWEGYDAQKNYANGLVTCPWILSIDADEALSDTLRNHLVDMKERGFSDDTVYSMNRLNNYCGVWIHHSGWYPDEKVRLWHKDVACWDGSVHEELRYARPVRKERLAGELLHYTYDNVQDHAMRQVHYAVLAAEKSFLQGKRVRASAVWLKPKWTFFRNYVLKGGFLDGHAGYLVCRMSAFYTMIKCACMRELQQRGGQNNK